MAGVLHDAGYNVAAVVLADPMEAAGVNDRAQLAVAEAELRDRINERWMRRGVTMWDPERTYIDSSVELEPDIGPAARRDAPGRTTVCGRRRGRARQPARRHDRRRGRRRDPLGRRSRRDRSASPGSAPTACSSPGAQGSRRGGRRSAHVLEADEESRSAGLGASTSVRSDGAGSPEAAGACDGKSPSGARGGDRRPSRSRAHRARTSASSPTARSTAVASSVRGADVFIIQTHADPVNDSIMEQLIMIDAAKRASAKRITAVCPYYGYSRQDRKSTGREPITAKLVADMLQVAGADRVVSVDLHSGQIQGFFDVPFDHLVVAAGDARGAPPLRRHDLVVVAPDAGRVKVAERYSHYLNDADIAVIHKRRPQGLCERGGGDRGGRQGRGRHCVLLDDMIDTAGTICAAAELLVDRGAADVWAMATHAVLSDPALERLEKSPLSRVVVTNTLPLAEHRRIAKLEVLSVAKVIADAIDAVFEDTSVSEIFGGDNLT